MDTTEHDLHFFLEYRARVRSTNMEPQLPGDDIRCRTRVSVKYLSLSAHNVTMLLYCRTRRYCAAENRRCSEEFPHNSDSVCLFVVDRGADVGIHKSNLPHHLSLPALSVEKQETPDEVADVWQIVVSVQFCQEICGQCTVLSSNLWPVYSSIK